MKRLPPEKPIELTKEQKTAAIGALQACLTDNLDCTASGLQAELLLDHISKHIGIFYYNKAIADAITFMAEKTEDLYLIMKDEPDPRR